MASATSASHEPCPMCFRNQRIGNCLPSDGRDYSARKAGRSSPIRLRPEEANLCVPKVTPLPRAHRRGFGYEMAAGSINSRCLPADHDGRRHRTALPKALQSPATDLRANPIQGPRRGLQTTSTTAASSAFRARSTRRYEPHPRSKPVFNRARVSPRLCSQGVTPAVGSARGRLRAVARPACSLKPPPTHNRSPRASG
jgi:hypothetical protein